MIGSLQEALPAEDEKRHAELLPFVESLYETLYKGQG
jgi:hypothetical protein